MKKYYFDTFLNKKKKHFEKQPLPQHQKPP
jgi:hypothetical protein